MSVARAKAIDLHLSKSSAVNARHVTLMRGVLRHNNNNSSACRRHLFEGASAPKQGDLAATRVVQRKRERGESRTLINTYSI